MPVVRFNDLPIEVFSQGLRRTGSQPKQDIHSGRKIRGKHDGNCSGGGFDHLFFFISVARGADDHWLARCDTELGQASGRQMKAEIDDDIAFGNHSLGVIALIDFSHHFKLRELAILRPSGMQGELWE